MSVSSIMYSETGYESPRSSVVTLGAFQTLCESPASTLPSLVEDDSLVWDED